MAGSRLDRIGTIFSRVTGLLKSGAVKYQDRPVWFDVYRVFPPKYEPYIERQPGRSVEDIPSIMYKEDKIRALFFKRFGSNPENCIRRLQDHTYQDPSTLFVHRYLEVQKQHPEWEEDKVFEACAEDYQSTRGRSSFANSEERIETVEDSVSGGLLAGRGGGRGGMQRKVPLVTPESLRSLFEEAKAQEELKQKDKESTGGESSNEQSKKSS